MPRNYDTTGHKPYPRITKVEITYSEAGIPQIEYIEHKAIVDGDRRVQHLGDGATRHRLELSAIAEPVQVVHPATGLPIPGQIATTQQLMLGLLAFLRADQLRRDAEQDAALAEQADGASRTQYRAE